MATIGYIRFSKADQGERMSPALQRRAIETWAAGHGLGIDRWFQDSAPGPTPIAKRPGLQAALAALGPGSTIVCYRLDRLVRDLELQLKLFRLAAQVGGRIVSAAGEGTGNGNGDDDDPDAVFLRQLQGALAQRERGVLALRIRDGVRAKKAAGRKWCRDAPFGYRWTADDRLAEKPSEQRTIRLVRELRAGGMSFRAIVAELARLRRVNRAGNSFTLPAVQRILRRPV